MTFSVYVETAKGKKINFLSLALILAVVGMLIFAGWYFLSQREGERTAPVGGAVTGEKPVATGQIKVPEGPKINVVFNGPKGLEVLWTTGMDEYGFQLQVVGTLKNISDQPVKFEKLAFLIDGQQIGTAFPFGRTLAPGEEAPLNERLIGYTETSKTLEVRVVGVEKIGVPTGNLISVPAKSELGLYLTTFKSGVAVFYEELPSAQGKVDVVAYERVREGQNVEVHNISNGLVSARVIMLWRDDRGREIDKYEWRPATIKAGDWDRTNYLGEPDGAGTGWTLIVSVQVEEIR